MHCLWDARWICSFLSVFSNLKDLSQIFFPRHREILLQFIEQGSTTKTYHSLQSPHGYLFISSYILESIDQNMSKSHVNMKLSFASRKPIAELFSQYYFPVTSPIENPREPAKCFTYFEISHQFLLTLKRQTNWIRRTCMLCVAWYLTEWHKASWL